MYQTHFSFLNTAEKFFLDIVIRCKIWEQTWCEWLKKGYLTIPASYYKACLLWLACKIRRAKLLYSQNYVGWHPQVSKPLLLICLILILQVQTFCQDANRVIPEACSFWRYGLKEWSNKYWSKKAAVECIKPWYCVMQKLWLLCSFL